MRQAHNFCVSVNECVSVWLQTQLTSLGEARPVIQSFVAVPPRGASLEALATTLAFASAPTYGGLRGGLLSSLGEFVIRIRILMYRDVSCVYPEGYMYPSCILMYLKCILNALLHSKRIHVSWYFACILHVSQTSPRYILGYISDTSRYMYLGRFLGVTLDTYQDTSGYVYLGLFITIHLMIHQDTLRIHRDTKSRYMYLGRFLGVTLDTYQDTSGYVYLGLFITIHLMIHQDTPRYKITIHVSWMRHDEVRIWDARYIRDTCEIHVSARVIKIHAGYIQDTWWDTCISNASRERCIWYELRHAGYMRDTCGIHAGHVSRGFGGIQAPPQVGLEIRILECIPLYLTCIVHVSCVSCIWGLRYIVF
jgi:hypothetical protein